MSCESSNGAFGLNIYFSSPYTPSSAGHDDGNTHATDPSVCTYCLRIGCFAQRSR